MDQIRQSNEQSVDLTAGPKAHEFFSPAADCVDLIPKAATVRAALVQAGVDAKTAIALLDRLRALCPNQ